MLTIEFVDFVSDNIFGAHLFVLKLHFEENKFKVIIKTKKYLTIHPPP